MHYIKNALGGAATHSHREENKMFKRLQLHILKLNLLQENQFLFTFK